MRLLQTNIRYLEKLKDQLAEQRIENLKNSIPKEEDNVESKDTHVDLSMEMFITHNKQEQIVLHMIDEATR